MMNILQFYINLVKFNKKYLWLQPKLKKIVLHKTKKDRPKAVFPLKYTSNYKDCISITKRYFTSLLIILSYA